MKKKEIPKDVIMLFCQYSIFDIHVFLTKITIAMYNINSIGDQNVIHIRFNLIHVCIVPFLFWLNIIPPYQTKQ